MKSIFRGCGLILAIVTASRAMKAFNAAEGVTVRDASAWTSTFADSPNPSHATCAMSDANSSSMDASRLDRRLDHYCNPNGWAPLLPFGPHLCGFPDQDKYNQAARAVLDALQLAHAALQVLGQCDEDPSLTRYFDIGTPGVRDTVFKVFSGLVGPSGLGAPEMLDPGWELEVWWRRGSVKNQGYEPLSCSTPSLGGFTIRSSIEPRWTYIVLCPDMFLTYQPSLEDIGCDQLGDIANLRLATPGTILLHEYMHWSRLTLAHAEIIINDWNWEKYAEADPPNGYGAFHASILQEELKGPIFNADNYMWFAIEAYFSQKCGVSFGEQIEEDPLDTRRDGEGDFKDVALPNPPQARALVSAPTGGATEE